MKPTISILILSLAPLPAQVSSNAIHQTTSTNVSLAGKPVARVNGAVLTDRDLQREMYAIFPYARQHGGAVPKAMEAQIRQGAMNMIVFEELVYQEAQRRKLTIPDARLRRALADFRTQFASEQDYQQFIRMELDGSQQQLQEKVTRSLLIEQMLDSEVAKKSAIGDREVRTYYDTHPDTFRIPESFAIQTISVLPPNNASMAQLKEARKRADEAFKKAKATKSYEQFGVLAEQISDDDYRVMMGDHKAAEKDKLPPEILKTVVAMKVGDISELIQIGPAYCIVRLNGHTATAMKTFQDVKDSLRDSMHKNKTEALRRALDKRLRATAKIEVL